MTVSVALEVVGVGHLPAILDGALVDVGALSRSGHQDTNLFKVSRR